jgi:hypothetical protein
LRYLAMLETSPKSSFPSFESFERFEIDFFKKVGLKVFYKLNQKVIKKYLKELNKLL